MNISPLQKARYEYAPKLPGMLRHGIADICVKEGEATQILTEKMRSPSRRVRIPLLPRSRL